MHGNDWFWDEQWQAGEREASAQIAAGAGDVYESDTEFRAALDDIDPTA